LRTTDEVVARLDRWLKKIEKTSELMSCLTRLLFASRR